MKCPKCQAENRDDAEFCGDCGITLEVLCPKCGRSNPISKKFCDKCGQSLAESKETPPIDYSQPQSYTPQPLADKILTTRGSIEGERKLVTVLFADVAGFTSMSEKLDPEEVHQIMDGCFKVIMDEIHRYEGTIDKFTGDGVMALFGAPVAHEDHAQRACYAALAIQRAIGEYSEKTEKECGEEFKMRVGIDSGHVIVGSVGNDLKMDYTAIGDPVNLASRMEGLAEPSTIYVTSDTVKLTEGFFTFESLGKVSVKGKEEPVEAYRLGAASEIETRFGVAAARGLVRFVGRKKEIVALEEAYEKAQVGSGQVIGIVGEAGVGKSRLLHEMRRRLRKQEHIYLEGRCLHYGGSMAYLPFLDILKSYFDINEEEHEFAIKTKMADKLTQLDEKLLRILPPLQEILSLKVDNDDYLKLEPAQKREKIFEAIKDLLIRDSEQNTLILAVEDLHWIDKTSEEFLNYLIGSLAGAHLLLILLYRPEYTHQWGSKSYYGQIHVDQLSSETSAELVQAILEEGEVVPELQELILNRAAGNPLFMEEFAHTLLENGSIQKKDHQFVLSTNTSNIQVPDTIHGIIDARIDRLEDNLKRTIQIASVIGRDFAYRILQTITGMREELKSYLFNLQGLEFIYEKSLLPELEYIFKHALTQEVAYNSLLLKRRREIHEKIGQAIEELYSDRLEEFYEVLAHHYSKSDDSEKAYRYLILSGEKTARSYSNWEAFSFYKEAISILEKDLKTTENQKKRVEARLLMTTPMRCLGFPDESLHILQQGVNISRDLEDERSLALLYSILGFYYSIKGDATTGSKYCEDAFVEAQKIKDLDLMASIAADLLPSYLIEAECSKLAKAAPKVIDLIEKSKRESETFSKGRNIYSELLSDYGLAVAWLGHFDEGQALCDKGLRFAIEINDSFCIGWSHLMSGWVPIVKGDGQNAVKHFQDAVIYTKETQNIIVLGQAWGGLGWGYQLLGEMEEALRHAEMSITIQKEAGVPLMLSVPYRVQGMVYLELGDMKKAHSSIEQSVKLAHDGNEKGQEGLSRIWLGRVLGKMERSQFSNAKVQILQGIDILNKLKLRPHQGHLFLGELYLDNNQSDKALDALNKAESGFQEMGMDYWLRRTQEALERVESK